MLLLLFILIPLVSYNTTVCRLEIEPVAGQRQHERIKAREQRHKDWEWERYLSCSHVPHPKDRIAMANFLSSMAEAKGDASLPETHTLCQVQR